MPFYLADLCRVDVHYLDISIEGSIDVVQKAQTHPTSTHHLPD